MDCGAEHNLHNELETLVILYMDIETSSHLVNLVTQGAHAYAEDAAIIIARCLVDDDPEMRDATTELMQQADIIVAHNATFERLFYPDVPMEKWRCTMAMAKVYNIPASLDKASEALNLEHGKDPRGAKLMRLFSIPDRKGRIFTPEERPKEWAEYVEYCDADVRATRSLYKRLPKLSGSEQANWILNEYINERGLILDTELVNAAVELDDKLRDQARDELLTLTGLENPNSRNQLLTFLQAVYPDLQDLRKGSVMALPDDDPVVFQRKILSSTASKKYAAMQMGGKGTLNFYGASNTGRWSGRRIQPQNMARPTVAPDRQAVMDGTADMPTLASTVRSAIIGDPYLTVSDYSQIEARVLMWLAGDTEGLHNFRDGKDLYQVMADKMGTSRQIAKGIVLGASYGGGKNALIAFGIAPDIAERSVASFRRANPKIVKLWHSLSHAVESATSNPTYPVKAGKVAYAYRRGTLVCKLPSGRCLYYHNYDPRTNYSGKRNIWHGVLVENVCQAIARDILAEALIRVDKAGLKIVTHVHDEVVTLGEHLDELNTLMCVLPDWAEGSPLSADGYESLPLSADGYESKCYRK